MIESYARACILLHILVNSNNIFSGVLLGFYVIDMKIMLFIKYFKIGVNKEKCM